MQISEAAPGLVSLRALFKPIRKYRRRWVYSFIHVLAEILLNRLERVVTHVLAVLNRSDGETKLSEDARVHSCLLEYGESVAKTLEGGGWEFLTCSS